MTLKIIIQTAKDRNRQAATTAAATAASGHEVKNAHAFFYFFFCTTLLLLLFSYYFWLIRRRSSLHLRHCVFEASVFFKLIVSSNSIYKHTCVYNVHKAICTIEVALDRRRQQRRRYRMVTHTRTNGNKNELTQKMRYCEDTVGPNNVREQKKKKKRSCDGRQELARGRMRRKKMPTTTTNTTYNATEGER